MKIVTILGARPQFVKAAVVSRAIKQHNLNSRRTITEFIIHTGQHFDRNMSDIFFEEMEIPKPDKYLGINQMSHGAMTGRMLEEIEGILMVERPDVAMVYGDTNSTLAGALAAVKLHIPVAHVEAGLRSFNRMMPEEHNRVLTDHISTFLLCPTVKAVENLIHEGFKEHTEESTDQQSPEISPAVFKVGDVMCDAALYYSQKADEKALLSKRLIKERLNDQKFALVTVHREENTNDDIRFRSILSALEKISETMPIVWPVHPRTRKRITENGMEHRLDNSGIIQVEPVGYFDMLEFLRNCSLVLTDSGGLQKEAYFFQKPCVTLRDETEWVELVDRGYNKVVGADTDEIIDTALEMSIGDICFAEGLYGTGNAGQEIVTIIGNAS